VGQSIAQNTVSSLHRMPGQGSALPNVSGLMTTVIPKPKTALQKSVCSVNRLPLSVMLPVLPLQRQRLPARTVLSTPTATRLPIPADVTANTDIAIKTAVASWRPIRSASLGVIKQNDQKT